MKRITACLIVACSFLPGCANTQVTLSILYESDAAIAARTKTTEK